MNNQQQALSYLNKLGIKPKAVTKSHIQISCPVCNDHEYKYRGFCLLDNPETIIYNCFNCETGATSFYNFLKSQDNNLANQYFKETKKAKLKNIRSTPTSKDIENVFGKKEISFEDIKEKSKFKKEIPFTKAIYTKTIDSKQIDEEFPLLELPQDALLYLSNRGFKREDYEYFKYCKETNDIVIPFWSNKKKNLVYGMQMRNLTEKRFHNQNLRENLKISNLEYILTLPKGSTIYLFEGEFDRLSTGIKESVAVIGSKLSQEGEELLKDYKKVYCFDADDAGFYSAKKYAENSETVLVHEQNMIEFKDFNKLLEMGVSKESIKEYIMLNIQKPLKARILLKKLGY